MGSMIAFPPTMSRQPEQAAAAAELQQAFIPQFGVPVTCCTWDELKQAVKETCTQRKKLLLDNINLDILWHAHRDAVYRDALTRLASVILVDGEPVRWLARIAGVSVPERLALTDVVPGLFRMATENQYKVFIVGSNPRTLREAYAQLEAKGMMPEIVGVWSEPRERLNDPQVNQALMEQMQAAAPHIVFVALGSPWQTKWIARNWEAMPNSILVPVGGAFDFIAGAVGRAPQWMQRTGTEWVYRMLFDRQKRDRSLFERYILNDLPFMLQLSIQISRRQKEKRPVSYRLNS